MPLSREWRWIVILITATLAGGVAGAAAQSAELPKAICNEFSLESI